MSNMERAAEIIEGYYPPCEKCRGNPHLEVGQCQDCAVSVVHIAADLAAQGLLAPDDLSEEWTATVRFTNEAGQWETHTGMGGTEQEALDDARTKQRHLYQPREDAYRTAWRWISKWHMNDQVTHLDIVEGQPDE